MNQTLANSPTAFDSEVCARIPISFITSVQPHGYLLVIDRKNFTILQVSQNLAEALGLTPQELVNQPLANFVMAQAIEEIRSSSEAQLPGNHIPSQLFFSTPGKTLNCLATLHLHADYLLLELEENKATLLAPSFINVYQQVKQILNTLRNIPITSLMLQKAAQELSRISGFDRVMIYKFDKDWNGTVVAEAAHPAMEPYLDLRFPASDIPKQARELYLRTPYRSIPDVNYIPSPLFPSVNPVTNAPADLSDCSLRGVPEVHIEYLQNMQVGSSLSTSIIKEGQLWGLISCHHRSAKFLSYELRSAFELLANVISAQLIALENEFLMQQKSQLADLMNSLLEQMSEKNDFVEGLTHGNKTILDFLNLSGAVLINEGQTKTIGLVPSEKQITQLWDWLGTQNIEAIYHTDSLPKEFGPASDYKEIASGLLAISLSADNSAWVIGLRPEVLQQVKWGGNPNEHLVIKQDGEKTTLHPRNSFALWKQIVQGTSEPWLDFELQAAQLLRNSILEVILQMQILKRVIAEEEVYQLSVVASKTDNAVLILNKNGTVEWVNQAFSKYTGVDLKAVIGKKLQDLKQTSRNLEEIGEVISKSNYKSSSFSKNVFLTGDDRKYYINFRFTPIANQQQEFEKCVAIGTDITQMHEYANQLEAINKELDKFAYIIAHDLKAPLRAIESLTDAISGNLEAGDNFDTPELLHLLKRSVRRMSHLVTDVLSYSRVGRVNLEKELIDVNQIIAEVMEWLNPGNDVELEVKELPSVYTIKADLQQIFSNLIGNSIKHSGKVPCHIEIGCQKKPGEYLFYVKDNGKGIPKDYHARVFDMFTRAPNSSSTHDDLSTGIGLATVKKLVEDNNGRIWIESEPDKGVAFYFTLPLHSETDPEGV